MASNELIINIGLAFTFITMATLLSSRLKYSSIPFLIVLGMLVGPHAPILGIYSMHLVSPNESIEFLSRLGVLLMLFYLGLEFSAGKLAATGRSLFKGGTVYVGLNFIRGLVLGWFIFNSWTEAMVVAGITGISSSAIITKLLVDLKRTANPETELILGIMVFEDVFLAIYLSVLSGILLSGTVDFKFLIPTILLILVFISSIIVFGKRLGNFLEPKLKFKTAESFTIVIFTLLLLIGIFAEKIHVAEAIGALLLGLVLAETTHSKRVTQMITPMRDLFGAVFFFSFGMTINYRMFDEVILITLIALAVTLFGNIITGFISAWLSGYKKRKAFNVAFTIMARGEFSVIVASLAVSAGANELLPNFAALYVLILAFLSPLLAKNTKQLYQFYEHISSKFNKNNTLRTN